MEPSAAVADDVTLLGLIAQQRDPAAFSSLYSRFKGAGYSLALNITGDPSLAEEALQEGMMRVWSSAGKFRADLPGGGNVKAWVMKIIARESIKAVQNRKRRRREIPQEVEPVANDSRENEAASSELVEALQRKLQDLAEVDRHCIALHIGGGLSQSEVGEAMNMPQQTVSHRIQRALKTLRDGLATSGFAAVTVLSDETLQSALSSGHAPPPYMSGRIKAQLSKPKPQVAKTKSGFGAGSMVAAVVVVAAAGAAIWLNNSSTPALAPAPTTAMTPPPAVTLPQAMRWTFEKQPGTEFYVGNGKWEWQADKKAMQTSNDFVVAVMPVRIASPCVFSATSEIAPNAQRLSYGLLLHRGDSTSKISKNWRRRNSTVEKSSDHKAYFTGRYMVEFLNGVPVRVIEYEEDVAGAEIMVVASNLLIYSLESKPLTDKDFPPELQDIQKLTAEMVRIDTMTKEEQERFGQQ